MSQHAPLASILIPTRERARTLQYCLQTVLEQDSEDYEVIVSDNASQDDTGAVVGSFHDTRLRYVNTLRRVPMCDNFEFALNQARGRYVMAIGDDDGLMPGAISELQRNVAERPSAIYTWDKSVYVWPLGERHAYVHRWAQFSHPHRILLGDLVRFNLKWGGASCTRMPNVYHSFVSAELLDVIRRRTGRVFHSTQPDVFTGFALPALTQTAFDVGRPLSLHGTYVPPLSRKSASLQGSSAGVEKLRQFVRENAGYELHNRLYPQRGQTGNLIADAILRAIDLFSEYYQGMRFSYESLYAWQQADYGGDSVLGIIRRSREMRMYHPFSTLEFCRRYAIAKAYYIKLDLTHWLSRRRSESHCPDNIAEFICSIGASESVPVSDGIGGAG